jgi:biopolymer transport protein ExbD
MSELNITPLLDLVFVLLVIFIITTPQLVNNLEMTLPSGQKPPPNQAKPKLTRILVDDTGQAFLNDTAYTTAGLKAELEQMKEADPEIAVVVKGSDVVEYQGMVNVLDVLQQLGITKVALATQ